MRRKGNGEIRLARTCYRHLAGRLGTLLCEAMVDKGYLQPQPEARAFAVTASGQQWLQATLAIDSTALPLKRRELARACLDWSERRDHLAGVLGEALCTAFVAQGLVQRRSGNRSLLVTAAGHHFLRHHFDLVL
ncbi:hypothetical protein D3C85_1516390 [compost metagenome]